MKKNRQTTAAKAAEKKNDGGAKGAAKGNGYWRKTTRKGERVLIDPHGRIYHGTPEEIRDAAMAPGERNWLAQDIKWARDTAERFGFTPGERREYVREKRRDAIKMSRLIEPYGVSIHIPTDVYILLRAGARLVSDSFDEFLADLFQGDLEGLTDVAENVTGKREIPLTRYERAALERIRATRPQIEAERKATDENLARPTRATA